MKLLLLLLGLLAPLLVSTSSLRSRDFIGDSDDQLFGYVTVKEKGHMFYWLMKSLNGHNYTDVPLVIWIQGGPGASGTGFGNFGEIGPQYVNGSTRTNTWLNHANLMFIDNPVGTGYSYCEGAAAECFTKNNEEIALDLMTLLVSFMKDHPEFQKIPLFIFSESYGGKMTSTWGKHIIDYVASKDKEVDINLKGIALGDSWIHPLISTNSWIQYLLSTSLIDSAQADHMYKVYIVPMAEAIKTGKIATATELWVELEGYVSDATNGIDWYNILYDDSTNTQLMQSMTPKERVFHKLVGQFNKGLWVQGPEDGLDALMNGPLKDKLKIPKEVTWGGQSDKVFITLAGDFMTDVVDDVKYCLDSKKIKVVVYTGQLDLIVNSIGTEQWVENMNWSHQVDFNNQTKVNFAGKKGYPLAFKKSIEKLSFYYIMKAGHMIPTDQLDVSVKMLLDVIVDV